MSQFSDRYSSYRCWLPAAVAAALWVAVCPLNVWGYTPESPVVKDMVDRGIAYLETLAGPNGNPAFTRDPTYEGGVMLAAYTHHKVKAESEHPVVEEGVATARALANTIRGNGGLPVKTEITYETSVAVLLLIDVDPSKYATDIQMMGNALIQAQKPHGGFGYMNETAGDTSQTQYCVLAMWMMDQADFEVPKQAMRRAVEYLMNTQELTSGRWGYKYELGNGKFNLIGADTLRHSLTSAGAGSILIGGDFFGLWRSAKQLKPDIEGFPPALKEQTDLEELKRKRESFPHTDEVLMQFINRTEGYFAREPYQRGGGKTWHYYYLYTLERYKSFLELAKGKQEKEPQWYNEGVEMIRAAQLPDGSWGNDPDMSHSTGQVATSFAVLFLIRSTKKAIGDIGEGVLAGGYGLEDGDIVVQGTQIKKAPSEVVVSELLKQLENEDSTGVKSTSLPDNLKLAADPQQRKEQLARLERVARGSKSYEHRRVSIRLLAQSDSLDAVPTLIYALTDPDMTTQRYARDGLRFISRRMTGFGMPLNAEKNDVKKAVKDWQQWYQSINPGYVFFEY